MSSKLMKLMSCPTRSSNGAKSSGCDDDASMLTAHLWKHVSSAQ